MGTCKTCKWWVDSHYDKAGKICDRVGDMKATKNENTLFDILMDAADDTGIWAALRTGPDFGCTYHEPK